MLVVTQLIVAGLRLGSRPPDLPQRHVLPLRSSDFTLRQQGTTRDFKGRWIVQPRCPNPQSQACGDLVDLFLRTTGGSMTSRDLPLSSSCCFYSPWGRGPRIFIIFINILVLPSAVNSKRAVSTHHSAWYIIS